MLDSATRGPSPVSGKWSFRFARARRTAQQDGQHVLGLGIQRTSLADRQVAQLTVRIERKTDAEIAANHRALVNQPREGIFGIFGTLFMNCLRDTASSALSRVADRQVFGQLSIRRSMWRTLSGLSRISRARSATK